MNPTAIFSKSGKGVQEASGKTSQLSRGDRAVLSAIDGRATLADVAGKVGKQFDNDFKALIGKLDKDGFIREVSPGQAAPAPAGAKPAGKPAAPSKPTAPMDMASDLDFTAAMAVPKKAGPAAPPPQNLARAPAPPPKPTVVVPPKPPPPSFAEQALKTQIAKDQQSAFAKAREEAEQKAQEQRDRLKAEAEAKVRAETEAKLRVEAEKKAKEDADAAAKKAEADRQAAIRAAAEAKVKAEAEAKRAREEAERAKREAEEKAERARQEAERARKEAEEKAERARQEAERARKEAEEKARKEAERARKEAEEKARREQEELKRKLEEERRAREEAERKAKEEAERARRELEEERRKLEAERKQREEEAAREEEERKARRAREEEEEQQRRRQREEEEEAERTARRKQREEEEERERAERAERDSARRKQDEEDEAQARAIAKKAKEADAPKPKAAATGDAFADSLLADLDSFTQRDDEDRKAKEEAEKKEKAEKARRAQEEAERQEREAAEARQREEDERRRKEEEAQRLRDEEEKRAQRAREEQEQAEREAEERRKKIAAASGGAATGKGDDIGITDDDLEMDEVKKEAALLEKKRNRKEEREKEREREKALKREREAEAKSKKEKERAEKEAKAAYAPRRRKSNFGRNAFIALVVLAVIGVGVAHVMPLDTAPYESAATEALGRPVKIGSGRFSLIGGLQYKFENVNVGGIAIPTVRAYPELGSLVGERKVFERIELDGMTLPQDAIGEALFAKVRSDSSMRLQRITAKNLKLAGPLPLPVLEADAQLGDGGVRTVTLRGGEGLVAKLNAKESSIDFDVNTSQFTLPFAPGITLVQFGMKGEATRNGMKIAQWDGLLYSGHVTGTANVRWGNTWNIDGVLTARGVNAAVFAPALMSNGRGEGTGRFTMSGAEPAKLGQSGRLEGNFTVTKGVLGSFDLSRALQTNGRQMTGQTQFAEMSGQGVYDRGAVSLRNVNLGAGALNAGASVDIAEGGALSGRIIADVKSSTQNLRMTLMLGGTVQEPTVRN